MLLIKQLCWRTSWEVPSSIHPNKYQLYERVIGCVLSIIVVREQLQFAVSQLFPNLLLLPAARPGSGPLPAIIPPPAPSKALELKSTR